MQRRHAINRLMLPADIPIREAFAMAARAGFNGVELLAEADPTAAKEVLESARATGLGISSVVVRHPRTSAYLDRVGDELEANTAIALVAIRNAADWGAGNVLVTPGEVDANTSAEVSWRRSAEVIATRLVPVAEQLGVVLGIENTWRSPLLTARELAAFVDEQGSSSVGALLDVGNVVFGHPEHWIAALGERLVGVHYKDYTMRMRWGMGYFRFGMVGSGWVDWTKVDAACAAVGYHGWLTHAGVPPPLPLAAANRVDRALARRPEAAAARVRTALGSVRRARYAAWAGEIGRRAGERDAALSAARARVV